MKLKARADILTVLVRTTNKSVKILVLDDTHGLREKHLSARHKAPAFPWDYGLFGISGVGVNGKRGGCDLGCELPLKHRRFSSQGFSL